MKTKKRLGDFFTKRAEKGSKGLPTWSVTINNGLVSRDTLKRKMDTNLSESDHLLIRKGDIAYNMMRMWQGALGLARQDGLVSPAYVVLAPTENIDPLFAAYWFKTPRMIYLFWAYSYGLTKDRLRLYYKDFTRIPAVPPSLEKQKKIAEILSTWDRGIEELGALIVAKQKLKRGLMQQLLTGKSRFPQFGKPALEKKSGKPTKAGWRYGLFDDLFKVSNDKKTQVKSQDYLESGSVPIVDQGQKVVVGFTNSEIAYQNVPVIIFGDHTRIVKWIDFKFAQGADGTQVLKTKASLDLKFGYYLIANANIPSLGYSRHMRELKEKDFKYPLDKLEQKKIALVLSTCDNEIDDLQQMVIQYKEQKRGLMQQLLTGKVRVDVNTLKG